MSYVFVSAAVNTSDKATAAQYNNLRLDAIGHDHDGVGSAAITNLSGTIGGSPTLTGAITFTGAVTHTTASGTPISATTTTTGNTVALTNNDPGNLGVILTTLHNSASPALNDAVFRLLVTGKNSAAATTTYAQADVLLQDPVAATEDAYLLLKTMQAGTLSNAMLISGGSSGLVNRLYGGGLTIDAGGFVVTAGDVTLAGGALATNATTGFTNIPTCAGPPTGAYTPPTGTVALVFDSTNNFLYVRTGGAWKKSTVYA